MQKKINQNMRFHGTCCVLHLAITKTLLLQRRTKVTIILTAFRCTFWHYCGECMKRFIMWMSQGFINRQRMKQMRGKALQRHTPLRHNKRRGTMCSRYCRHIRCARNNWFWIIWCGRENARGTDGRLIRHNDWLNALFSLSFLSYSTIYRNFVLGICCIFFTLISFGRRFHPYTERTLVNHIIMFTYHAFTAPTFLLLMNTDRAMSARY